MAIGFEAGAIQAGVFVRAGRLEDQPSFVAAADGAVTKRRDARPGG